MFVRIDQFSDVLRVGNIGVFTIKVPLTLKPSNQKMKKAFRQQRRLELTKPQEHLLDITSFFSSSSNVEKVNGNTVMDGNMRIDHTREITPPTNLSIQQ